MGGLWGTFLEVFQVGLFWLTQLYGGQLAPAIVTFSILARLALLPATVRLTLRARAHARKIAALRPRLVAVRERWSEDPERLARETLALYRRNELSPVDAGVMGGSLLQSPVFIGMYHAVRDALRARSGEQAFLWVSNLARPDLGIAALAFCLVGASALAGASESQPAWTLAVPALVSAVMALTLSAGFGLYLAATGLVGTLQGLVVRRIEAGGTA